MTTDKTSDDIVFPFTSPEELDSYIPYLITRLANRWSSEQNKALADFDLQGAKMRVLSCLSSFDELTINELSILSVTEQSTTSRTVEQLVAAGLVERSISAKDQRVRTAKLTADGSKALKKIAPAVNDAYQDLVRDTSAEDLRICIKTLAKLLSNVKQNQI
ncbi:MarR family winged helix-turn-helix transcriptional regulator [Cochlodiniinecator piscidefendens]|uniref:MarR family winged helix-turn-helix transcriptional regulator n=1 Tax=Cochlodiniinecator piscidefendens TaxID=2715756 RepID=UPI00140841ED|nr:MarR family winged helix-turn-helix transcriptional regulator [Cochlodiniinecator piscidefendens]